MKVILENVGNLKRKTGEALSSSDERAITSRAKREERTCI